jgi:predicted CoA-binding protein
MDPFEGARRFLARRRFAVVGVSRDPRQFSRALLRELLARGYDAVPVNPAAAGAELEGRACAGALSAVRPPVEAALLVVPASAAAAAAREAIAAGVRQLWFHGGSGRLSTPEAIAACRDAGVEVVDQVCPLMVLPEAGWFHRMHARFRRRSLARARQPGEPAP